ncbi:MAG: hypothetical protein V5A25_08240, partial [Halovenus sp.]
AMAETDGGYSGTIPAEYVTPEWDLLVYLTATRDGDGLVHPGLFHPEHAMPYYTVAVSESEDERSR